MFEMMGALIGLMVLAGLLSVLGFLIAAAAWLLFWGRPRPKRLILMTASVPPLSLGYALACAAVFAIFVPNQPDQFFGDFSEPLPNGYVLTGLGKMPEYASFDTDEPGKNQPSILGGVQSLELDGETVYGVYSHPKSGFRDSMAPADICCFVFDTHSGQVQNLKSIQELNAAAGHPTRLVESQFFRSQDRGRIRLREVENTIYLFPPSAALLFCFYRIVRVRIRERQKTTGLPCG